MLISPGRVFGIKHFMLCVMMLVLSLRALVPAGFMPDVGALRDGRLEMTFCTSTGGTQTIPVELDNPHHGHTAPSSDETPTQHESLSTDCPFNVLTSMPAMPSMALALVGLPLLLSHIQLALRPASRLSLPVQGPPLGSQAPPFHHG